MGFERYVDYMLDVPMYFVYRDGHYIDASGQSFRDFLAGKLPALPGEIPSMGDWVDHLTTAFPEVRLKRFLEMRGADGGPWDRLCALPALWVGLLYDSQALDAAWDLVKDWTVGGAGGAAPRGAAAARSRPSSAAARCGDSSRDVLPHRPRRPDPRGASSTAWAATRATSSTPSTASPIPARPRPRRSSRRSRPLERLGRPGLRGVRLLRTLPIVDQVARSLPVIPRKPGSRGVRQAAEVVSGLEPRLSPGGRRGETLA